MINYILMKKIKYLLVGQFLFVFLFSQAVWARLGVGVGTGKIEVDEKLMPGMRYELPDLSVLNTGDESSYYEVKTAYHTGQEQIIPDKEWFEFNPREFHLDPGEGKQVKVTLNLSVKAMPGDYFVYLEGRPIINNEEGKTSIGIAAAAKLYFTVAPANILQGIYYKVLAFWIHNQPWTNIAAGVVAVLVMLRFIKNNFNIQVQRTRKNRRTNRRVSRLKDEKEEINKDE